MNFLVSTAVIYSTLLFLMDWLTPKGRFVKKIREPSQLVKYKISPQLPIVFIPKIKLKMVGDTKVIVWLCFSSLLAFMGSADSHAIDTFSNALLPISAHTCPSTDVQMSQTEWNM